MRAIVNAAHLSRALGVESAAEAASLADLSFQDEVFLGYALEGIYDARAEAEASAGEGPSQSTLLAPNRQTSALLQTFLSECAAASDQVEPAAISGAEPSLVGFEARFAKHDLLGWARAFVPWAKEKLDIANRDARPTLEANFTTMPNTAKIAVIGDWGTNLYGAPAVGNSIANEGGYALLIHLGDVYYTGSMDETQQNLLAGWQRMQYGSPGSISRTCNSNHEMYSGGRALYTLTLPAFDQVSTAWAICNDYWMFIGLDVAYIDHDLDVEQLGWLERVLSEQQGRQVVLFSHHQLFSTLSGQGAKLQDKLRKHLQGQRFFAWYWGHEHLLALYDAHPVWRLTARCVGHGGFPYYKPRLGDAPSTRLRNQMALRALPATKHAPKVQVLTGHNQYLGDQAHRYGPNGYMRIHLDGPHLYEEVVTPEGVTLWTGQLS